jgi:hypothetical protein
VTDAFADMTDQELENRAWELAEDIKSITEQIDGVYQLSPPASDEVRVWLSRAHSARRYRRAELRAIQHAIAARQPSKQARRESHIGQLVNARFVKAARGRLKAEVFEALMQQAREEARAKLDDNGAPAQAA